MKGKWVEPDVRDDVVSWVLHWSDRAEMNRKSLLTMLGLSASTFYHWSEHFGIERSRSREFVGWWGITPQEEAAILRYRQSHEFEGYRRLCYQMLDEGVVAVSPATVYRVLKKHDLLSKWNRKENKSKGRGFVQPVKVHQHWHVDISYVKIHSTFFFLTSVLDGFSRYIVHSELRKHMEEYDVEMVVQRALESFPGESPRIISDNGSQFISRDFKEFLSHKELKHVRTSVRYPQSNGKIESFHKTIKRECVRRKSFLNLDDTRKIIDTYISDYNNNRLHSSIFYLSPKDVLMGKTKERLHQRDAKLKRARELRKKMALERNAG